MQCRCIQTGFLIGIVRHFAIIFMFLRIIRADHSQRFQSLFSILPHLMCLIGQIIKSSQCIVLFLKIIIFRPIRLFLRPGVLLILPCHIEKLGHNITFLTSACIPASPDPSGAVFVVSDTAPAFYAFDQIGLIGTRALGSHPCPRRIDQTLDGAVSVCFFLSVYRNAL